MTLPNDFVLVCHSSPRFLRVGSPQKFLYCIVCDRLQCINLMLLPQLTYFCLFCEHAHFLQMSAEVIVLTSRVLFSRLRRRVSCGIRSRDDRQMDSCVQPDSVYLLCGRNLIFNIRYRKADCKMSLSWRQVTIEKGEANF